MLCCVWLVYSHDTAPIATLSNQTYITYQMTATSIEAISDKSLLSIEYLTVYRELAIGPAAVYKSECTCIVSICVSVCRVVLGQEACGSSGKLYYMCIRRVAQ